MKIFILILSLVIINITFLVGEELTSKNSSGVDVDIEEHRNLRYEKIPNYSYKNDTDRYVIGTIHKKNKKFNKLKELKNEIKEKVKLEKQWLRFRSTYLDFTILEEENIS